MVLCEVNAQYFRAGTAVTLAPRPLPIFFARIKCKPAARYRTTAGFLELGSVVSCIPDLFVVPPYLAFYISSWWHFMYFRYSGYAAVTRSYRINFLKPAVILGLHRSAAVVWN
jgi:hypothetical protein